MTFDLASAFARAKPGDTITCTGNITGPVKLLSVHGGEKGAPIVIDLNGHTLTGGLKGLGSRYVTVRNGVIRGGVNGVQFGLSGALFTATCEGLVLENLDVAGVSEDAIKVSQANDVTVRGCKLVCGPKGQCVDFVNVSFGLVQGNDCTGAGVAAAIAGKGATTATKIAGNMLHDLTGKDFAAIEVGGYIDLLSNGLMAWVKAQLASGPEAQGVSVLKNTTARLDGPSLRFTGAARCSAGPNTFDRARLAVAEIGVQPDNRAFLSTDAIIHFHGPAVRVVLDKRQNAARDRISVTP